MPDVLEVATRIAFVVGQDDLCCWNSCDDCCVAVTVVFNFFLDATPAMQPT